MLHGVGGCDDGEPYPIRNLGIGQEDDFARFSLPVAILHQIGLARC